eukprot:scaffold3999_cov138-Skeletonema_dohrnii-CCMP3373.AAC.33
MVLLLIDCGCRFIVVALSLFLLCVYLPALYAMQCYRSLNEFIIVPLSSNPCGWPSSTVRAASCVVVYEPYRKQRTS